MKITTREFNDVVLIDINNESGLQIILCNLGASIYQLDIEDSKHYMESVVLSPLDIEDFKTSLIYAGKSIGRFSGRIANGTIMIDSTIYHLDLNDKSNSLHGGNDSLAFQKFSYQIKHNSDFIQVVFNYLEKENQLPGDVFYQITYTIYSNKKCFQIDYYAKPNKTTLINLTNHTYFNLSGNLKSLVLDHHLKLYCNYYYSLNEQMIPIKPLKVNKVMSFLNAKKIKKHLLNKALQEQPCKGYDHCYIKKNKNKDKILILKEKKSKRKLVIYTSYDEMVMYTYNYPNKNTLKHQAIAFECQLDGLNKKLTNKNQEYQHYIRYDFS